MPKSLIEQLPEIVADGRRTAEKILEGLEGRHRVSLHTRELVLPARDSKASDWIAAHRQAQQREVFAPGQTSFLANPEPLLSAASEPPWTNRLIYGDNLLAMAALLAGDEHTPSLRGKVDLIYIDPPFDSKADYRTKVTLPALAGAAGATELEQKPTVIEQFAYSDTWADGTASYLAMITPRLVLMRELLADTGSIYVHLDWHVGHYVKLILDDVFGKANFRNEIIWHYSGWNKQLQNSFEKRHDTLFLYSKTESQYFASFFEKWASKDEYVKKRKQKVHVDTDGRDYVLSDAGNGERIKRYLDEVMREGVVVDDVWPIDKLNNSASEAVGYATQKTLELLGRVVSASCPEGGLVFDCFGGSGTTAAVAEKLGRRWITTDLGKPACMIMRKRLIDQDAKPFLYQSIGDYQVEAAKATLGRDFRMYELSSIVLSLYGALPLPSEVNPQRNLGQVLNPAAARQRASKTLVLADSPNKLTGTSTLKKAIAQRDNLLGGYDHVVVLGWNFEPSIGQDITALNDPRLEVLVIPPDLMDQLKKTGGMDKLRGKVRFSSLQYLTLHPLQCARSGDQDALTVRLKNYVLLSPEAINLDDDNRRRLQAIANQDPLALIEYWGVDPDYDGQVFRSVWQDYRGNTANDADPLRVVTQATLTLPAKTGPRTVCVRVVDVFGYEAEVVSTVRATAQAAVSTP